MIFWFLETLFALMALGGLIMIFCGIRKPDTEAVQCVDGEEILIDLPCHCDEPHGLLEPGQSESIGRDEKQKFDPEKHQPEVIGGQKKD